MDSLRHITFLGGGDTAHGNMLRCSYLESKTEPTVAKAHNYIGGTPHRKQYTGRWGTPHILDWVNNLVWEGGHHTYFVYKGNNWGGDTHH